MMRLYQLSKYLVIMLLFSSPIGAPGQNSSENQTIAPLLAGHTENNICNHLQTEKARFFLLEWLNTRAYAEPIDADQEKMVARQKWAEMLGIDIFSPYFTAKEIETTIKNKTKTQFFGIRGRAEFNRNTIQYIFKVNF